MNTENIALNNLKDLYIETEINHKKIKNNLFELLLWDTIYLFIYCICYSITSNNTNKIIYLLILISLTIISLYLFNLKFIYKYYNITYRDNNIIDYFDCLQNNLAINAILKKKIVILSLLIVFCVVLGIILPIIL